MGFLDFLFGKKKTSSEVKITSTKNKQVTKKPNKEKPSKAKQEVKPSANSPQVVSIMDTEEKNDITYYNNKKFTGIIEYRGNSKGEFKNGVCIGSKDYFPNGTLRSIKEMYDGELVETKGWVYPWSDDNGDFDYSGERILIREFKDGKKIEYYENGNIKNEKDVKTSKSDSDSSDTFVKIKYYENGNIDTKEVKSKYAPDGMSGGDTIEYSVFYETGELQTEKVDDKKYTIKHISYFKNKKIKSIAISDTPWLHEGHTFEFDEAGNEVSKIDPLSDKENEARKHLKLKTAKKEEVTKAKKQAENELKAKEKEIIELTIPSGIDDVKIKTTLAKFESAKEDSDSDNALDDYSDDYKLYLTSDMDAISNFFKRCSDDKLVFIAEHSVTDEELGDMQLEEVSYVNCECPDKLKKYYNGECFLINDGKLLETNSEVYKKIDFDELWDTAYISNSGVLCYEYSTASDYSDYL